ncbi:MAG: glycoside hydrolase family 95 protein [Bacteroidetes bacterium]|nr:MAG: glycoside hydrolase family 95 protein [Bacteroidota bacterium]
MKQLYILMFCVPSLIAAAQTGSLKLWYKQPASASVPDDKNGWKDDAEWLKALPLGNGNIGAMVFGDVNKERIQLNEKTLWSGSHDDNDNPDAPKYLSEIRRLLFEGKFKEATELTNKTQVCKGVGSGKGNGADVPFGCFQTLGDLRLEIANSAAYTNYYRDLDLNTAIASVRYTQHGVNYKREYFISAPGNVMVVRFSADKKGCISFSAALDRPERFTTTGVDGGITMQGALNNGKGGNGMEYMVRLKAKLTGGKQAVENGKLVITTADEAILYLTASTNYLPNYPVYSGRDYKKITATNLNMALASNYAQIKKTHIADYQKYFNRVTLNLAGNGQVDNMPTDERLKAIKESKNDNYLTQLFFQYGRYLLIASSRENTLPANLQGIWANKIQTPWNGDYHTNINLQMNYWLAENTNLSELHLSMINFVTSLEKPATKSALVQFGMQGWCIGPIVNVWGFTSPGEHPSWGLTSGASGWVCQHLWEHYLFTLDKKYLTSVYPTLKKLAKFYLNWLVVDPETGKLVSGPAASPENSFIAPDKSNGTISMGPSHDQQIIDEVFATIIDAALILNDNDQFVEKIKSAKNNLLKVKIGDDGRLLEWAKPYVEAEPGHRHMSHLYAFYPGHAFTNTETPQYVAAAKKSIEYRLSHGGGQTGWSAAWVSNFWARFKNGDGALQSLNDILITKSAPNLFGLHPPFQIDGNFGAAAGIAEMLLQSHEGCIELLPALPSNWNSGEVKGLCARGGFAVSMKWKNGKLAAASVLSKKGGKTQIVYNGNQISIDTQAGKSYPVFNQLK